MRWVKMRNKVLLHGICILGIGLFYLLVFRPGLIEARQDIIRIIYTGNDQGYIEPCG